MVLSFPLSLADFWEKLQVARVTWISQDNSQLSGMSSGQILEADLAPSLRIADVTLRPRKATEAAEIEALIEGIRLMKGSFYAYDPRKCVPASDPHGNVLGSSEVQINSLPDPSSISLKQLPASYKLTVGDTLSFNFGTNPVRRAYHRILETNTASGLGVTPVFQVSPFIMGGATINTPVSLIKPAFKAIIRPGTIDVNNLTFTGRTNISFSIVQKI